MSDFNIPFAPPFIDNDVKKHVLETLESGWITSGPKVDKLEEEFAAYLKTGNAVAVNSWTSGAHLVLKWLGVGEGDEVIVPAYTYAATALAVLNSNAKPVMVDVGEDFNMDPAELEKAITPKTKAIIPVDFAGLPCEYNKIDNIVNSQIVKEKFKPENDIQEKLGRPLVISDAAHSIGATYLELPTAVYPDITIFSLHAVKNITTAEGGIITSNLPTDFDDQEVAEWMKLNSLNGQTKSAKEKNKSGNWRYDIVSQGLKINMPDICAAIGLAQIRKYNDLLEKRIQIFQKYTQALSQYSWAQTPTLEDENRRGSAHLYPLRIKDINENERDTIIKEISKKGVSVNVHFVPLPMLSLFDNLGYKASEYPKAVDNYSREISLPIYPQLKNEEVEHVIETVIDTVEEITERAYA